MKEKFKVLIFGLLFLFFSSYIFAQTIKEPSVAGQFYPANPKELSRQIDDFLNKAHSEKIEREIIGLISPHAGYIYSGQVAAYGYSLLKDRKIDTVIIIGPSHFVDFDGIAVWAKGAFKTPLGKVLVDEELSQEIIAQNPEVIKFYSRAFQQEHSVEVQVPLLQKVLANFKTVPILIAKPTLENAKVLANSLNRACKNKNILIIASSDMSHYYDYKTAVEKDKSTLSHLSNLDAEALYNDFLQGKSELCGMGAVLTLLLFAKENNLKLEVLKYANSGDVTFQLERVVGYTSCVLYKDTDLHRENITGDHRFEDKNGEDMLNDAQKKRLLEIARKSLENYLTFGKRQGFNETDPALTKNCGAFVTLEKNGELRGCIGHISADGPLYQTVADMAIEAGTADPRFQQVDIKEMKDIEIEISVLSPLELITDVQKIEVGKHGILLRRGFYSGLLLPQVASEYGWNRDTFLKQTCLKAGLDTNAWQDKTTQIYIFSALVFSEKELK